MGNAPLVDLDSGPARGFEGHTVVAGCRAIVVVEEERHLDGGDAAGVRIEDGRKPQSDRGSGGLGEVQARRGSRSGSEGKSIQPNGPKAISYRTPKGQRSAGGRKPKASQRPRSGPSNGSRSGAARRAGCVLTAGSSAGGAPVRVWPRRPPTTMRGSAHRPDADLIHAPPYRPIAP